MVLSGLDIASIVYQVILFLVGVPGNLLIILTYCRKRPQTSSGVFIIAMALADLGVCLMSTVVIYNYVVFYDYPSNAFCKFRYYTNHGLIYVSRFLTIAVAVERYLAVCQPMSKRIPPRWAAVVAAACVPVGYLLTVPIAVSFGLKELSGDRTICTTDTSSPAIKWVLRVSFPITFLAGLLVVVVCYALIFRAIRKQMRIRAKMTGGPGKTSGVNPGAADDTTSSSNKQTVQTSIAKDSGQYKDGDASKQGDEQDLSPVIITNVATSDVCLTIIPSTTSASEPHDVAIGKSHSKKELVQNTQNGNSSQKPSKLMCFKKNKTSQAKSSSMDSTTKMLLIVTVIYFTSFLPQFIGMYIPRAIMTKFRVDHKIGYDTYVFVRRMITINHIINPFVYGFVNKRFRDDCFATLKDMKRKCSR